jgi:hypothetical protein
MKNQSLIKKLETLFPESVPVSTIEWNGVDSGIWFKGSEDYLSNGEPVFDHYNAEWDFCINPRIAKVLKKAGYYAEPYDSGTCMAYPI